MDLFILDYASLCEGNIATVVSAVKYVFTLIQWAIPAVLIVLGTIDMFKAMTSGDEKETKAAQKKFITRLIYAVVAFLVPFIVSLVFTFAANVIQDAESGKNAVNDFLTCWKDVESKAPQKQCYDSYGNVIDGVSKESVCVQIPNSEWK